MGFQHHRLSKFEFPNYLPIVEYHPIRGFYVPFRNYALRLLSLSRLLLKAQVFKILIKEQDCWQWATAYGITGQQLILWNPSLNPDPETFPTAFDYSCNFAASSSYCLGLNYDTTAVATVSK